MESDCIAGLPGSVYDCEAVFLDGHERRSIERERPGGGSFGIAVEFAGGRLAVGPGGDAEVERERGGGIRSERESDGAVVGVLGFLGDFDGVVL